MLGKFVTKLWAYPAWQTHSDPLLTSLRPHLSSCAETGAEDRAKTTAANRTGHISHWKLERMQNTEIPKCRYDAR